MDAHRPLVRARAVADALMFEGYLLYPYRATAPKNQLRWQFGVVAPPRWSQAQGSDPDHLQVSFLIEAPEPARLIGQLRFLQPRRRRIEVADPTGIFYPVPSLERGGRLHLPFDEADVREVEVEAPLAVSQGERTFTFEFRRPGSIDLDLIAPDSPDDPPARLVKTSMPQAGHLTMCARPEEGGAGLWRVNVRVENRSDFDDVDAPRDEALRASLLSTHLLLAMEGGRFLSLIDPPAHAAAAARACRNTGLHPVLVEEQPGQEVLLATPFILHDYPRLAPESGGDFCDATEIDELLTLRTMTLTDEEKRLARATDPRAAAILDRVEAASPEELARLHGTFREVPAGPRFHPGARVRLRPGPRRTDAQDMFLEGKIATVESVLRDVDGRDCVAVTLDDDPGSDLFRSQGRFLYFYGDEVEAT